jgi:methyl-accepting chemotaxis protein
VDHAGAHTAGARRDRSQPVQPVSISFEDHAMFRKFAGLSTRTKLTAILISLLVPLVMLFYFDIARSLSVIRFSRGEDFGNDWARPLVDVARNLSEHRDHALRVAGGHEEERAEMNEHKGLVEESARQLDQLERADVGGLASHAGWSALRRDVLDVVNADVKAPGNFAAHNAAAARVLDALHVVANESGLELDPEAASYSLISAFILQMPGGLEALALARRHFDSIAAGEGGPAMRTELGEQLGVAAARMDFVFKYLTDTYATAAPQDLATISAANDAKRAFEALLPKLRAAGGSALSAADSAAVSKQTEELTESLAQLQDNGMQTLEGMLNQRVAGERRKLVTHVVVSMLALLLAVAIQLGVTRYLASQVGKANAVFANMEQGRFETRIGEQAGDELGVLLTSLDRMQRNLREKIEAERLVGTENARIRQALDATTSNVMVADEGNNIIYMNRSAIQLMNGSQADFRATLPQFDAAKLVGTNIDVFHKNPAHQRGLLSGLSKMFSSELRIGSRTMRIIANPIFDEAGKRLGTVVEWGDRTQELAVEGEVQKIVTEAINGNLDQRISLDGKEGFFRSLSGGINELVENVAAVVAEVQTLVGAVNEGNLARRIRTDGKSGLMVRMGAGVNDLTANIATVVDEVQGLVNAANDGDLTRRIETQGKSGLLVKVGSGVNELTDGMAKIVSQVKVAAGEVSRGAEEISQGNANLSQRTEEQASSLEETASSMEEMTSTVKQNADNAGQANQLALAAREQAEKGGAVVARAVKAMTEINDASSKIANIIGVIDEIAFQTNLLALNAAVEAARAGEQGRGFAVVATEVRNLAGRSATAAKEIKALIQDSVKKVEDGSTLVEQSGLTLEQIVGAVKKVTDIVAEIAAASHEQSAGIEQVNKAVMQLDELTQQNAALVEEASAASQSMAEQARGLNDAMSRYEVDADQFADALLQRTSSVKPVSRPPHKSRVKVAAVPSRAATQKQRNNDEAVWKEF